MFGNDVHWDLPWTQGSLRSHFSGFAEAGWWPPQEGAHAAGVQDLGVGQQWGLGQRGTAAGEGKGDAGDAASRDEGKKMFPRFQRQTH